MTNFVVEDFHDIKLLSVEKLTKLRDRAAQHALESARAAAEDMGRYRGICHDLASRD